MTGDGLFPESRGFERMILRDMGPERAAVAYKWISLLRIKHGRPGKMADVEHR